MHTLGLCILAALSLALSACGSGSTQQQRNDFATVPSPGATATGQADTPTAGETDMRVQPRPAEVAGPGISPTTEDEVAGPGTSPMSEGDAMECPIMQRQAQIVVQETPRGAALVFTTANGDRQALQEVVERMAAMHAQHHGEARGHRGHGAGAGQGGGMGGVAVDVRTEPMDNGIRMIMEAQDPAQVAQVREHARRMADQMRRGECPMMGPSQPATPAPTTGGAAPR